MNIEAKRNEFNAKFKKNFRMCVRNRSLLIGSIMILIVVLAAIFADVVAPYEYDHADMSKKLLMPCKNFLFGTDDFGRDAFSRA